MKKIDFIKLIMLSIFVLIGTLQISAQSNMRLEGELQTPSADSWKMVKNGEVGANLYTGTVNLSIPFYTYKDKDFEIPIVFNYASNGLMPNLKAGVLGPDWTLNVGGTITVDVKGIPDYTNDQYGDQGFFQLSKQNTNQFSNPGIWRVVNPADVSVSSGMFPPFLIFCPDNSITSSTVKYDAEPDIYHFNFMGYSGTFHRGFNNVTYIYNTNTNNKDFKVVFDDNFTYINITTSDGYKYIFSTYATNSDLIFEPIVSDLKRRVAWKLSKIVAPNGRKVTFNYDSYFSTTCTPASFDITGTLFNCPPPDLNLQNNPVQEAGKQWEHAIVESEKYNLMISSIQIENGPTINFSYNELSESNSDAFNPNVNPNIIQHKTCFRLTGINVISPESSTLKSCSLSYINNNSGAKINFLNGINISGEGQYTLSYYNWNSSTYSFPGNGTLSVDHWGYYNGKNNNNATGFPFLKLGYLTSNYDEVITSNYRNSDANYAKTGMLEKIIYPTGGYSVFDYESNDYSTVFKRISSNNFNHAGISESGLCGGLRLKSIYNYTALNQQADSRLFEYLEGTSSSGILLHFPRYNVKYNAITSVSPGGLAEINIDYYSSSVQSFSGAHIEYSKVTEKRSDNSKIEYTFTNSLTSNKYVDEIQISNIVNEPTIWYGNWNIDKSYICSVTAPVVSKEGERGKLIRKDIFKSYSDASPLYSEIYAYNTNKILATDNIPVYLVRKFGYTTVNVDNYKLLTKSIIENQSGYSITNDKKYSYNSKEQLIREAILDSKGDSLITKYTFVTDIPEYQITTGSVYRAMLDSNIISYPLKEEVYLKRGGGSEVLISGKKYTYVNPVTTNKAIVKISKIESYDKINDVWYTEIEYLSFDNKGNILESKDRNGIYTSYVWGYNGLYMVAKVENLDLNTLKNSSSTFSSISTSPLSGAISIAIQQSIRSQNPNAKFTFFDYIPFVGLTKIVDPSGKVTEYQYNANGKLKGVKDGSGKFHNEYFYSPDNKL